MILYRYSCGQWMATASRGRWCKDLQYTHFRTTSLHPLLACHPLAPAITHSNCNCIRQSLPAWLFFLYCFTPQMYALKSFKTLGTTCPNDTALQALNLQQCHWRTSNCALLMFYTSHCKCWYICCKILQSLYHHNSRH